MTSSGMGAASIADGIVKIQNFRHCLVWTVRLVTMKPIFFYNLLCHCRHRLVRTSSNNIKLIHEASLTLLSWKLSFVHTRIFAWPEMELLGFNSFLVDLNAQWQNLIDIKSNLKSTILHQCLTDMWRRRLCCHAGCQEASRCRTRGESQGLCNTYTSAKLE